MYKNLVYLVTVDYVDESMQMKTVCDFVELVEEDDNICDIKSTIRSVLDIPRTASPIKIISMCPMLHLQLED